MRILRFINLMPFNLVLAQLNPRPTKLKPQIAWAMIPVSYVPKVEGFRTHCLREGGAKQAEPQSTFQTFPPLTQPTESWHYALTQFFQLRFIRRHSPQKQKQPPKPTTKHKPHHHQTKKNKCWTPPSNKPPPPPPPPPTNPD